MVGKGLKFGADIEVNHAGSLAIILFKIALTKALTRLHNCSFYFSQRTLIHMNFLVITEALPWSSTANVFIR